MNFQQMREYLAGRFPFLRGILGSATVSPGHERPHVVTPSSPTIASERAYELKTSDSDIKARPNTTSPGIAQELKNPDNLGKSTNTETNRGSKSTYD